MSYQRPTDDEIRERASEFLAALNIRIDAGDSPTDPCVTLLMSAESALRWVLGEENTFDDLCKKVATLVRKDGIRQSYKRN